MSNRRMGPAAMGPRKPISKATVKRLLGYVKPYWPRLLLVLGCVILNAVATAAAATFLGQVIDEHITPMLAQANPDWSGLSSAILRMAVLYALAIAATFTHGRDQPERAAEGTRRNVLAYADAADSLF